MKKTRRKKKIPSSRRPPGVNHAEGLQALLCDWPTPSISTSGHAPFHGPVSAAQRPADEPPAEETMDEGDSRASVVAKTLTMGFWGERGLARLGSMGVCRTDKELGAEGKACAPPATPQSPMLTSRRAGMAVGEQEKSVPLPMASSSCCSLCCRASSLLVYSS
ncbi:hypothetical protein EYF80_044686 [Liparis tanakae]|uniref:Uncharacterized protein n=1 Tax=Liparis tanakae TaxID=230148 RepID=A0A4Z2FWD0_9TELE|nr:hypothetical protein EYF80_044686 [Liparis tanakae]